MFWRILWRLLSASRSRLLLALIAVASGAAICSALFNLNLDAGDRLTREFRVLGANVVVAPPHTADAIPLMDAAVLERIAALHQPKIIAAAPYLYISAQATAATRSSGTAVNEKEEHEKEENGKVEKANDVPVIVAGTRFDQVALINSWWKVEGQWLSGRDAASGAREATDSADCMVGKEAAKTLGLVPGSQLTLRYADRQIPLVVKGIVTAGGSDDSQVFVDLGIAQSLAGLEGRIGLVQISVRGSAPEIENVVNQLSQALPALDVLPVRQLAAAEGRLLERIRGLLFATVFLILLMTALGVLAAMAGLALERRRDVGLMKALGGSVRRVMRFFLAEATAVGIVGGVIGWAVGMLLSAWIGQRVFATSITPRLIVLPVTVGLMIAVSLAGALPLRLLGRVRPAEILRGE
jgi:putative ABC transport system permease protein